MRKQTDGDRLQGSGRVGGAEAVVRRRGAGRPGEAAPQPGRVAARRREG